MGRSQVLYNRTKGRNKNRSGRGGNRTSEESANASNNRKYSGHTPREQVHQTSAANQPKDYEHEYEVLFAGRTTFLTSKKTEDNDDEDTLLLGGSANGSICIPSMAATLESMEISKRLRIPMRVAAKAFPEQFRMEEEERAEITNEKEEMVVNSPLETENTVSDGSAEDLENWLDDACGITDDNEEQVSPKIDKTENSKDEPNDNKPSVSPKDNSGGINNIAGGNSLSQAEEELVDDNLEDWLDSVIE